jgi:hypothetical protein
MDSITFFEIAKGLYGKINVKGHALFYLTQITLTQPCSSVVREKKTNCTGIGIVYEL